MSVILFHTKVSHLLPFHKRILVGKLLKMLSIKIVQDFFQIIRL